MKIRIAASLGLTLMLDVGVVATVPAIGAAASPAVSAQVSKGAALAAAEAAGCV